jgi:DNA (cytosine-5)-methyltransferase 1
VLAYKKNYYISFAVTYSNWSIVKIKEKMMDFEIYSFFAGLGFLDLGFEKVGFNIAFVNEIHKEFLDSYKFVRRGNNSEPKYGYYDNDVKNLLDDNIWKQTFSKHSTKLQAITGFIGGPPCPDFSVAGKNHGVSGRNGILTDIYKQLIIKRKPDFFVLENVKGLYRTQKHKEFYERLKSELSKEYTLFDSIENALEYGVPQFRERLVLIGFKKDKFGEAKEFVLGKHKKYELSEIHTLPWPKKDAFKDNFVRKKPKGITKELSIEHWFNKNEVSEHPNAKDYFIAKNMNRFMTIEEGDVSRKSFKRPHRWRFAPTSAYGHNEVHLHPYKLRRLSVSEALAIQSAPKNFVLSTNISLSAKFKMVGNGVPFLLAKGIAKDIYEFLVRRSISK